jgi:DNA-binding Lrp family transcriptional regulator
MYQKGNNKMEMVNLYLSDYTNEFYLREIARLSSIPLKTTQDILKQLEKEGIIIGKTSGKNKYFRLNLSNIKTKYVLIEAELYRTSHFLDKYPVFKTFLKEINSNAAILVFGSFADYSKTKSSDLDLLVISDINLPNHLLPYKIHDIRMTEKSFLNSLEKKEAIMEEIRKKHIILNNHSFFINAWWERLAK